MKALITGITGFLGSHLAEHLLAQGVEVEGITRYPCDMVTPCNLQGIKDKIRLYSPVYITDSDSMQTHFQEKPYDYIFHLATERFLSPSWMFDVNVTGTVNLLEAVHKSRQHPVIVIVACGEMYGNPPLVEEKIDNIGFMSRTSQRINYKPSKILKLSFTEDSPFNPVSTYGVSKAAQDMLAYQYHKEYGMKIVRVRVFDITGPRCHPSLLTSNLAKRIIEIEKGIYGSEPQKNTKIKIASPEYTRDHTDVRDVARAMWMAATKCGYEDPYNICTSRGRTVQQVIDTLRMQSTAQFEVIQEKTMMRQNDIIASVGDCTKFYRKTGWKPEIGFAQSMGDLLEWWRGKE